MMSIKLRIGLLLVLFFLSLVWVGQAIEPNVLHQQPLEVVPKTAFLQTNASDPQLIVDRLNFDQFKESIRSLASLGDRFEGTQSNLNAVEWLQQQLETLGYDVVLHDYNFRGRQGQNVYVTKVGSTSPDRMYMVSAHMDGRGGGGAANDDGSGTALVLEVARALASPDVQTDVSIRMIFWNSEETGLIGSGAYANERLRLQGIENPSGSGQYPEPTWLGIIQHDMILYDHGLPPRPEQIPTADIDIEYQANSQRAFDSIKLARALEQGNLNFSTDYPVEITDNMNFTDSVRFQDVIAAVSVRENRRVAEIGNGSNPHYHQPTDVFDSYSDADFRLGFNALQMTLGTVAELSGLRVASE